MQKSGGCGCSQSPGTRDIEALREVRGFQGLVDGTAVLVRLLVRVSTLTGGLRVALFSPSISVQRRHRSTPEGMGKIIRTPLCGVRITGSRDAGRDVCGGGGYALPDL